ncbi:MAG: SirB2 family protein [Burkholderiaceae bacterium]|nr:SirB2 family protein [Burkholderiaceae bacterium]
MDYATLKATHVGCAALSIAGFVLRWGLMLVDSALLRARAARVLPHVIDTVLLASALLMAWQLRIDPREAPWLAAKIIALLAYIVLGVIALRRGRTRLVRALAGGAAIAVFAYIVSVALSRSALGFLAP